MFVQNDTMTVVTISTELCQDFESDKGSSINTGSSFLIRYVRWRSSFYDDNSQKNIFRKLMGKDHFRVHTVRPDDGNNTRSVECRVCYMLARHEMFTLVLLEALSCSVLVMFIHLINGR